MHEAVALRTVNGCPVDQSWSDEMLVGVLGVSMEKVRKLHEIRGLSALEICTMPTDKLNRAIFKVDDPKPDLPDQAASFRAKQQASDDGQVRPDGLPNALLQRSLLVSPLGSQTAGINSGGWTALGPGSTGGRVRAVLTDPADPNALLVGSVSGGLWKSSDAGASWAPINDFMPNVAISSLGRDPSNAQRIYAGTGEGFYNIDSIRGFGAFVSNDGGTTWAQLGGTIPDTTSPPATQQADYLLVNRVAVHPTNPDIVLLATTGYYCNWGGLYRTTNALAPSPTWTLVYAHRSLDVKFDPNNGNNVIVGEGSHCFPPPTNPNAGGAVGWSNNMGASFTRVPLDLTTLGRVEVAWAKATPNLAVAVTEGNGGSGADGRFWVSTDAGQTWSFNSKPGHLASQGWYNNAIWVDPTDSKRIMVGGLDNYRGAGAASWWTTNTAVPWTKITQWFTSTSVHADNHAIVEASNYNGIDNRVVYIGNDGGIYKSSDIAAHNGVNFSAGWSNLNNGLQITQFYGGAGKSGYPGGVTLIVGGTQDNGSLKAPASGTTWSAFFGGDGGYAAVDPVDPNIYYGEYVRAAIHRATTGGNSSIICGGPSPISEGLQGAQYCGGGATSEANFIAPFILDPNNANTMLVGAKSLWRSVDVKAATPHWATVKSPDAVGGNYISAITVAPGNSDLIWVGHNNGAVYCTINGTASPPTWTKLNPALAGRMVLRIMVDPSNTNRIFVTYGGYNSGNVLELTDATQVCKAAPTVTNRHGNLPQAPVRSIVRHPSLANTLYASTEVGVFTTGNGGVSWSTSNDGPGTVSVDELFWLDPSTLVAASHGRGMFSASLTSVAPVVTTGSANGVAGTGATLNGIVGGNGAATTVTFEYGTTTGYGTSVPAVQSPLAGSAPATNVSAAIAGLTCNTTYHFRALGANSGGTTNGGDAMFTTTAACGGSTNANLSNLVLSQGSLSPAFASGTTSYTANVVSNTNTITVTPTAADPTATIKVNGVTVASGSPSGAIALVTGNNVITTVVTAQDGLTTKTYTVSVNYLALSSCTYSLLPTDLPSVAKTGGLSNIVVTTPAGCPVTATSFQPWVVVSSITPNGATTTVSLQINANPGAARATSIVVAGRLFLITQLAGP